MNIRRFVLAVSSAFVGLALFAGSGGALANNSTNSAMECGGLGLNPGQAFQLSSLNGGPAAGPDRTQTPREFAELMGADSVGDLLQRDCDQVH